INTDYYITYNNNGIISIPIEFSQLDGLYNISYINSYNYDINLEKEIDIKDVFNSEIDYMEIIAKKIDNKIKELSRELSIDKYIMVLDYLKDIIFSDNPTFYISKGGIVICFSSYELDPSISDLSTFKISFKEDRNYLSKYIIEKIIDI
ncbi:MAG: RsiV family protein, partial [Romboutsia timonensis]